MKEKSTKQSIGVHLFLIVVALGMIIPFVWMVLTSFKSVTHLLALTRNMPSVVQQLARSAISKSRLR